MIYYYSVSFYDFQYLSNNITPSNKVENEEVYHLIIKISILLYNLFFLQLKYYKKIT
jgi:hypothetical protein